MCVCRFWVVGGGVKWINCVGVESSRRDIRASSAQRRILTDCRRKGKYIWDREDRSSEWVESEREAVRGRLTEMYPRDNYKCETCTQ